MSDTPLTDGYAGIAQDFDATDYVVPAHLARALERDLRAMQDQVKNAAPQMHAVLNRSAVAALNSKSNTPRTDKLVGDFDFPWSHQMEMLVRHAEQLEIELAQAKQ